MAVEVKTDVSKWRKILEKAAEKGADALANQMMNDSIPFIPDDGEHNLRDIGRVENAGAGERALVWDNVYAGYQWYGVRADGTHSVKNYTTQGTGKAWVDESKAKNGKSWDKAAQNGFTEGF